MNTIRNVGRERGEAAAGDNRVLLQAQVEGVAMPVNPAGLIDVEVRTALSQMVQAITMKSKDMTTQENINVVQRENKPACSIAYRLRDFTRMNLLIFDKVQDFRRS